MSTELSPSSVSDVLFGKTRQAVLGLIFMRADQSFHLRQIARLTRIAAGAVQREMIALTGAGLVSREQIGRQVFYRADPNSPVHSELRALVLKTAGAGEVLASALAPLARRIKLAFVFGSIAAGQQRAESDLDLIVVSDDVELTQLTAHLKHAEATIGREINPILYNTSDFANRVRQQHHFLMRVLDRPHWFVLGDTHELERLAEERLADQAPAARSRRAGRPARGRRPRPARLQNARAE
jgi:predicted nucleotidyltransferase